MLEGGERDEMDVATGGGDSDDNHDHDKVLGGGRNKHTRASARVPTKGSGGDAGGGSSIYGPNAGRYSDGMKVRQANLKVIHSPTDSHKKDIITILTVYIP